MHDRSRFDPGPPVNLWISAEEAKALISLLTKTMDRKLQRVLEEIRMQSLMYNGESMRLKKVDE